VDIRLPDGRTIVIPLPDDGPHHVAVSVNPRGVDFHAYVDGRDAAWRYKGQTS